MSKKHKRVRRVLNCTEHLLILISTVTGCVFASLVGISIRITSSALGLKSVIKFKKKKKKKHDKIILLAKCKLNITEVLISKALIDPNISHDEFVLINNVLKKYDDMKEETINSNDK